jgi:hypothetical protein
MVKVEGNNLKIFKGSSSTLPPTQYSAIEIVEIIMAISS